MFLAFRKGSIRDYVIVQHEYVIHMKGIELIKRDWEEIVCALEMK